MIDYSIEKLKASLTKAANRDTAMLTEKDNLFENGYLDSLSLIQFIVAMENDFALTFRYSDVQFENFKDLNSLKSLMDKEYSKPQ